MPFVEALSMIFTLQVIAALIAGLLIGVVLGSLPGIGGILGMAIILPFTVEMDGLSAIIGLIAIYLGAMYGGAVSAILFNIPGTNAAVATTLDGYPLSKKGHAEEALTISALSSAIGGILAGIALLLTFPYLSPLLDLFGTPQKFLVAFLGIAILPLIARGSQFKSIFAASFGLLITTIGLAPMNLQMRYSFGSTFLESGIDFIAIIIGLFAVTEMALLAGKDRSNISGENKESFSIEWNEAKKGGEYISNNIFPIIKSSFIGTTVGMIPGAGAAISTFVSYSEAVRSSNKPESFGEGNRLGLLSAEGANNATAIGSLIPVLAFGIPGSSASAVILGGMILHGVVPGPVLFSSEAAFLQSLFLATILLSLFVAVTGIFGVRYLSYVTKIDKQIIIPVVIIFSITGATTLNLNPVDILTAAIFGIIGYLFKKYNYPVISLLLGAILGGIMETTLFRSLQLGTPAEVFGDPVSLVLIIFIITLLLLPHIKAPKISPSH